jgi:hypothetical protein
VLYQSLPRRFLEFFGSAGAIVCEMLSFNFWAVVHIDVVAMEAPADDLARFGFDTSAFAMGALPQPLGKRSVRFGRHRFCNAPLLLGCVLGARTKLDWAIAVVVSFHGQTTAAFAVPTALPVVPGEIAIMAVAHCSPNLPLMRLRAFDASHL